MGRKDCSEADTVGSTDYDRNIVDENTTYILTDNEYKVDCTGSVIAWEFCFLVQGKSSLTFYPGIWKEVKKNKEYSLVNSSKVTFTSTDNMRSCQMFNLSEQFIAQEDSFIGLYSNVGSTRPLLFTNSNKGNTFQISGNHSEVTVGGRIKAEKFNIAIRAHIGECNIISVVDTQNLHIKW